MHPADLDRLSDAEWAQLQAEQADDMEVMAAAFGGGPIDLNWEQLPAWEAEQEALSLGSGDDSVQAA